MTITECYAALGGNYEDVIGRLRSENLVRKFVLKFPADGSFDLLKNSLGAGDVETAFRAAHTIKGMCQNLSFDRLAHSASELTEVLRGGDLEGGKKLFPGVEADYAATVAAIEQFRASVEG